MVILALDFFLNVILNTVYNSIYGFRTLLG